MLKNVFSTKLSQKFSHKLFWEADIAFDFARFISKMFDSQKDFEAWFADHDDPWAKFVALFGPVGDASLALLSQKLREQEINVPEYTYSGENPPDSFSLDPTTLLYEAVHGTQAKFSIWDRFLTVESLVRWFNDKGNWQKLLELSGVGFIGASILHNNLLEKGYNVPDFDLKPKVRYTIIPTNSGLQTYLRGVQIRVYKFLKENEGTSYTPEELAEALGKTKSTISRAVNDLVARKVRGLLYDSESEKYWYFCPV